MISFFKKDKEKDKKKSKKSTKILDKVVLPISLNRGKINKRLNGKVQKGGITLWYKDGLLHNLDGPAIIWEDGSYQWYFNGIIHHENGPAATSGNNKYWYLGYDEPVTLTAGTAGTGTAKGDKNGYDLTLTDLSNSLPYEVSEAIATTIIGTLPVA